VAYEEDWSVDRPREIPSNLPKPLLRPPIGQADDEECFLIGYRTGYALAAGLDEQRPGGNIGEALDDERGVGKQATGVPASLVCVRFRS
jgi:hypothetical protein